MTETTRPGQTASCLTGSLIFYMLRRGRVGLSKRANLSAFVFQKQKIRHCARGLRLRVGRREACVELVSTSGAPATASISIWRLEPDVGGLTAQGIVHPVQHHPSAPGKKQRTVPPVGPYVGQTSAVPSLFGSSTTASSGTSTHMVSTSSLCRARS